MLKEAHKVIKNNSVGEDLVNLKYYDQYNEMEKKTTKNRSSKTFFNNNQAGKDLAKDIIEIE